MSLINLNKIQAFDDNSFNFFNTYINVGARIYGFGIKSTNTPVNSVANFGKLIVDDLISIINVSVATGPQLNPSDALSKAIFLGGQLSPFANFNPPNNRYNGSVIVIKQVNTVKPLKDVSFIYFSFV